MTVDLSPSETRSPELVGLSEEANRLRSAMGEGRIVWPEEFRKKVADLVLKGVPVKELVEATKVSAWSIGKWLRSREGGLPGFSELRVVSSRSLKRKKGDKESILLLSPRGFELSLRLEDLRFLLREKLL